MLLIKKSQLNNLVVSVSLNKELPNPTYLFSFQHIISKDKVTFIPKNTSTYTSRYDQFTFTEGFPTNITTDPPTISFNYDGQYWYSVYEQVSTTNTNPSLAYNKLAEGRALVIDNNVPDPYVEFISDNEDDSNFIFISDDELPVPTPPCPSNPELMVWVSNFNTGYDIEFSISETDTTSYPSPGDIFINTTLHLDGGGDITYNFPMDSGESFINFNYSGITGGVAATGYTMNEILQVPSCWTIHPTNLWIQKSCASGNVYSSPVLLPNGYEDKSYEITVFNVCVYTDGRYYGTNYPNTFVDILTKTFYTDCNDCLTS